MATRRTNTVLIAACAAAFVCGLLAGPRSIQARNGGQLVFAINLPLSLLGEGAADIIGQFDKLFKAVNGKYDVSVKLKLSKSWDKVSVDLNNGAADMAWMPPYYLARNKARNKHTTVRPLVTYEISGSTKTRTCLYVRNDSGIRDLDHLIGKSVAFADESTWVLLNKLFVAQKYPFRPVVFFGAHEEITRESAGLALHLKETDAIVMEPAYLGYIEREIPGFRKEIRSLGCAPAMTNDPLVYGKSMTSTQKDKLLKILKNMHKEKSLAAFRKYFTLSGGRWVDPPRNAYDDWAALYDEARVKGWISDYESLDLN